MTIGTCTYCGALGPVTSDHVPPKNLFTRPYPRNMWTVPACAKCNGGFSKDDDYFRTALTITEKAKGRAARDAILPTVMRGLNNPKARRHQVSLLSRSAVIERWSSGGVYLGRQRAIALDGRVLWAPFGDCIHLKAKAVP